MDDTDMKELVGPRLVPYCCFCVYWKNCPCQWHINNAACLTIQKVIPATELTFRRLKMNEHKITVSELIEYLKTLPSDYHVTVDNRDIDFEESIDVIDRWKEVDFR